MALNVFISYISNETFNDDMELKQGYFKPLKEWTQSINLGIDDDPKIVQIGTTSPPPTHKPTGKSRLRTDPCSRSSRLGSRGQRAYGLRNCWAYCGHTGQRQGHPRERHHSGWHTEMKQSSQLKSDSQATGWTTTMKQGMMRPYAFSSIW